MATAALAAVASTKQKVRGENDSRSFAIIVFTSTSVGGDVIAPAVEVEMSASALGSLAIASLRHCGQRQSCSAPATRETCGNSSHQQLLFSAVRPHVKLTPQFEQLFGFD